jgi:subtilisin family serine protease
MDPTLDPEAAMPRFRRTSPRPTGARVGVALIALALALAAAACAEREAPRDGLAGPQLMKFLPAPPNLVIPRPDNYVLQVAVPLTAGEMQALGSQFGLTLLAREPLGDEEIVLLRGPQGVDLFAVQAQLGSNLQEKSVNDGVYLIQGTTLIGSFAVGEWSTEVSNGTGLESLNAASVQETVRGAGVVVAVLDTGADLDHPLLAGNLSPVPASTGFSSGELPDGNDDDGDGEVDEAYGHGTHVTGIVCQIAPDVTVIPIRVLNADGVGSIWDLMRALQVAADRGAQIINLSLAMTGENAMLQARFQTLHENGIVVVAAAGNAGNGNPTFPGSSAYTVGVAAVDSQDQLAGFSGSGPLVPLAAPGIGILSTYPSSGDEVQGARATGTSMAAPVACGSLALLSERFGLTAFDVVALLQDTARAVTPAGSVAFGRVDPVPAITGARL